MTDLELYNPPTDSPTAQALALVGPAMQFVEAVVKTNFVPQAYRGKPAEALACVLTGEMLGLHPLVSMREIDVIQGTPAYSAKMQRALVQRAGHKIWLEEATATKVVMAGHRQDDPEHITRVTWTIDRAKTMGLTGKDNWRKQPQSMLIARATGELARLIAADELLGLAYNAEEVRDGTTSDEEVVEAVPVDLEGPPEGVKAPGPEKNRRSIPAKKAAAKAAPAPAPAVVPGDPLDDFDDIDGVAAASSKSVEQRRTEMVLIRTKEVLGDLVRDDRLAFYAASVGHPVASAKDLDGVDVDRVIGDLSLIEVGELAWVGGQLVAEAVVVEDEPAAAAPAVPAAGGWSDLDGDDWIDLVKLKGIRAADVLRQASALATGLGVDAPGSVRALADADVQLRAAVGEWLDGQS